VAAGSPRLKGFKQTVRLAEAFEKFLRETGLRRLPVEEVSLVDCLGRVLAVDVYAPRDIPPFDRAAMDGYALKAKNTFGASPSNPLVFRVIGKSDVASPFQGEVGGLEAVEVATGAPIPRGADAVVMFEFTQPLDGGKIEVYRTVSPGENVAKKGEDFKAGVKVLPRGRVLRSQDLAVLAALGFSQVKVKVKPRVAFFSVGRELVEPGTPLKPGEIYDVNRYFLASALTQMGCIPLDLGIIPDEASQIAAKAGEALEKADMLIVTGGSSAGRSDLTLEALKGLRGFQLVFHGVSIRPGRPLAAGALKGKPVVLLPGYPAAAMLGFLFFAKKILEHMLEVARPEPLKVQGKLVRRVASSPGILDFVRVKVKREAEGLLVEPLRTAGAGLTSSMAWADGLLLIPEEREGFDEGETVEVYLLRGSLVGEL